MDPRPTTTVVWQERMTFDATTNSGHTLILDSAPPDGNDRGVRPMDFANPWWVVPNGCACNSEQKA